MTTFSGFSPDNPLLLVKIKDPLCDPSYFGALEFDHDLSQGNIPSGMDTYKNLKRPTKLPGLHSRDKKFPSKDIEDQYMKYYDGEYAVLVAVTHIGCALCIYDSEDYKKYDKDIMFPPDSYNNKFLCMLNMHELDHDRDAKSFGVCFGRSHNANKLIGAISHDQMDALSNRLLHRFYRSCATCLPESYREFVFRHLESEYSKHKWWDELVDINTCYADSDFATRSGDTAYSCVKVGEALEAKGKFLAAASLYEEIYQGIEDGTLTVTDSDVHSSKVLSYAGLAYKRACHYETAEAIYIKSLWHDRNIRFGGATDHWDLNGDITGSIFANLALLYGPILAIPEFGECGGMLVALLVCGGYKLPPHVLSLYPQGEDLARSVKNKFRSRKQARRLLATATATPNVSDFRETIGGSMAATATQHLLNARDDVTTKQYKKLDKNAARGFYNSEVGEPLAFDYKKCNNATCKENVLHCNKFCPCGFTRYCSKDCQIAHWKEHKKTCTHRKKNKENCSN